MIDSIYIVYSEPQLDAFKRGMKMTKLVKPLFTNKGGEARDYNEKHPGTTIAIRKKLYYTKVLDILELYSYLSKLEVPPPESKKEESAPVKAPKKRGRPKKKTE